MKNPLTVSQGATALASMVRALNAMRIVALGPDFPSPQISVDLMHPRIFLDDGFNLIAWYDAETGEVRYGWEMVNDVAHHVHEHSHTVAATACADMLLQMVKMRLSTVVWEQK